MMNPQNLTVSEVVKIAGCHRSTLIRYERKGLIQPLRDRNGHRRFSLKEALELKNILQMRITYDQRDQ